MTDLKNIASNTYRDTPNFFVLMFKVNSSDRWGVETRYGKNEEDAWSQIADCHERLGCRKYRNAQYGERNWPCMMKARLAQDQAITDCLVHHVREPVYVNGDAHHRAGPA